MNSIDRFGLITDELCRECGGEIVLEDVEGESDVQVGCACTAALVLS